MSIAITTVFTNNRSQALRLPAEAHLPDEVKRSLSVFAVASESLRRLKIPGITFS
jgi:virulence-associated protein VagC